MKISTEQRPEQTDIVIPLYIEIMLFLVPQCCAFLCMFQNCSFTHPVKGFCGGVAQGLNECSGYCSSKYNVGRSGSPAMSKCTCCEPTECTDEAVMYGCDSKMPHFEIIKSPKKCECKSCYIGRSSHAPLHYPTLLLYNNL